MSCNGYSQFSPYYQQSQPSSQQNGSRSNASYGSSSFQPLSAYQSEHQRAQNQPQPSSQSTDNYAGHSYTSVSVAPSNQSTNSYSGQHYGGVEASTGAPQDPSGSYTNDRPDTTALGSLAYASSLGQDQPQPSLAQLIDYNRSRTSYSATGGGYDTTSGTSVSREHQRAGSQGSSGVGQQRASHSQPYSTNYQTESTGSPYPNQSYAVNSTSRNSPAQHQYGGSQQQSLQGQRYTQYTPQRPASGQAMQRPSSRTSRHNSQSPQASSAQMGHNSNQQNGGYKPAQAQATQQSNHRTFPAANSTTIQTPQSVPQSQTYLTTSQSVPRQSASNVMAQVDSGKLQPGSNRPEQRQPASRYTQIDGQTSQQPIVVENQPPTTVDPNQVFNHYEYQRRQSEAEAAKKVAEAAKANKTPKPTAPDSTSPPADDVTQAAKALMGQSKSANTDFATKEQIELEMKQMIEKMRDYKAKDPALFSQVWEDVKKGQVAQKAPSQSAGKESTKSLVVDSPAISPVQTDLPAESELPAASSFAPGFDRGRYPMQRRRRGNMTYTPDSRASSKKQSTPAHHANDNPSISAIEGAAASAFDKSVNQNMRKVLEQFKHNTVPPAPKQTSKPSQPTATTKNKKPGKPTASGQTYWPEHKKRALAEAARLALMSTPPNIGKTITADEIHALLDTNPSYAELCEHIEGRGFDINRPEFARMLLAAVPDMNTPNNAQKPPAPPPAPSQAPAPAPATRPRPSTQAPIFNPPIPPPQPLLYQSQNAYNTPYSPYPMPTPSMNNLPKVEGDTKDQRGIGAVKEEYLPQSKQDKARKRTFEDIVDLTTTLSDDDDFMRHRPRPKVDKSKVMHPQPLSDDALNDRWRPSGLGGTEQPYRPLPHRSGREHLLYELVVDPMNKKRDAFKKNSYDPRTICRDILLASGRHPTMPPLNHHLDVLRERFMSVENNADLSTFRWDLVDPGGAPAPTPVALLLNSARGQGTTIANDETAPHQSPHVAVRVNASMGASRPDFFAQPLENKTPSGGSKRGRPPKRRYNISGPQSTPDVATPSHMASNTRPIPKPPSNLTPHSDTSTFTMELSPNSAPLRSADDTRSHPVRVPGRKGRPPGAKNKKPRLSKDNLNKYPSEVQNQNPLTPPIAHNFQRETSTPVRPSGLRNAITPTSARIAVIIPSRSPSIAEPGSTQNVKGSGKHEDSSGMHPSSLSYKNYKCLWQACPAELHNLETLWKHIRKQHRERLGNGPWPCKWADCYDSRSSGNNKSAIVADEVNEAADGQHRRLIFANDEAWDRHVEKKHMGVYAWQLGDGPAVYSSDVESSDYLSDSNHQRVSPRAPTPSDTRRVDPLPFGTDAKTAREYHEAHNHVTLQDRDKAQIRALTAKKKAIGGMGIYMTGSDITNDTKRQTLTRSMSEQSEEVTKGGGAAAIGASGSLEAQSSSEDVDGDSDVDFVKV